MLIELRVENLLLIERAELRLAEGLNVLTGETGAGKTMVAHALDLLLGGKPRPGIVRPGAAEAWVEGVFELTDAMRAELGDRLPPDAEELVLARRVSAEGRSRALMAGRSATAADLREVGAGLLTFLGQHESRRLTLASSQLDILDGFCGPDQVSRRSAFAALHAQERGIREEVEALREVAGARDRELDLLDWELQEIEGAAPDVAEEEALLAERSRLRNVEGLQAALAAAGAALDGEAGDGAVGALSAAAGALAAMGHADPALAALAERLEALVVEAEDIATEVRRGGEDVDAPPGRLDEVEERLALFDRLKRKHGGTLEAVLEHADRCRARRAELTGAEEAIEEAEARLGEVRVRMDALGAELRGAREAAAGGLSSAVLHRLAGLAMAGARFEVQVAPRESPGPTGADEVEFLIAPNPGVPARPLRETASGGELSRVMLALMGVAAESGRTGSTLVFDEVDAGVGGQTARAVGDQLLGLAGARQVLVITHLPQVASLAHRHFTIVKDPGEGTARTSVTELTPDAVVGELVRMLGADEDDVAARRHAEQLLGVAA